MPDKKPDQPVGPVPGPADRESELEDFLNRPGSPGKRSPRDFIHDRMRQIEEEERKKKKESGGKPTDS